MPHYEKFVKSRSFCFVLYSERERARDTFKVKISLAMSKSKVPPICFLLTNFFFFFFSQFRKNLSLKHPKVFLEQEQEVCDICLVKLRKKTTTTTTSMIASTPACPCLILFKSADFHQSASHRKARFKF